SPPPRGPPPVHPGSAFAYFLTATVISVVTLLAFLYLHVRNRQPERLQDNTAPDSSDESEERKEVPLRVLFRKLFWLASAVFVTFAITMLFPVFTQFIVSVRPEEQQPPILQPASFIPLAFLFWNVGDLLGRMVTAVPSLTLAHRPKIVLVLAFLRIGFLGLYHLCNIRGRGAVVESDFFYLVVVQLLFGLTNGYLGSTCMIGAGQWVDPEEREAAGGFMGLCLVGGLTVGSLASFFAAGA
ncbi:nucleoside transporter family, partial [Hortaea werneckii]